jgi:glutamate-ammonia-ligase adenylyltransferase
LRALGPESRRRLIDLEFIAQYLQLVHAARTPEIPDTSTVHVLDKAWRLGLIATETPRR